MNLLELQILVAISRIPHGRIPPPITRPQSTAVTPQPPVAVRMPEARRD